MNLVAITFSVIGRAVNNISKCMNIIFVLFIYQFVDHLNFIITLEKFVMIYD